ncbi:Outer membrane usher protein papC precursor [Serratia fonticola]|uniref:Outer membrane usher protein papC n=1 Tax=Serratia fonticola TaxID=47917 RepID=A0A4V6KJM7_SERFO|nr:Outer membrane usher protein papC precursor [Serratia fonticola]
MYTVTFNKQFVELGLSTFINYSHQTYWNDSANDHYNLSLARYFDLGKFKDLNLSLTAYRNKFNGANDDGMYLAITIPWGHSSSITYSGSWDRNENTHQVGYFGRVNDADSYQISAGAARQGAVASGYYTHLGNDAASECQCGLSSRAIQFSGPDAARWGDGDRGGRGNASDWHARRNAHFTGYRRGRRRSCARLWCHHLIQPLW